MKKPKYPLEQVALIKKRRLEEAERHLKKCKETLETEQEKLKQAKEKLSQVKKHKDEKIRKFFEEMKEGTTSLKIERHDNYIKNVVDIDLKEKAEVVKKQQAEVKKAEVKLEEARQDRIKKNQEMEKIKLHREEWDKEQKRELLRQEASESDELGTSMHARKTRNQ